MAKKLLDNICSRFFNGVRRHAAIDLGLKETAYSHFVTHRPVKDWMLVHIRRRYGKHHGIYNGLSDTEILNYLEEEYSSNKLKEILDEYK